MVDVTKFIKDGPELSKQEVNGASGQTAGDMWGYEPLFAPTNVYK